MSKNPMIFHGEWWVPAEADMDNQGLFPMVHKGHEAKHTGTLTYCEDSDSKLEFYHVPSKYQATFYDNNEVMWGVDANGHIFTLFNVVREGPFNGDFTNTVFSVGLILMGEHVLSMKEPKYNQCIVQFPYLRNWAFHDNLIKTPKDRSHPQPIIDLSKLVTLVEVKVDNAITWVLRDKVVVNRSVYDFSINQLTEFVIDADKATPVDTFLKHVREFSQFLSVALYGEQRPSEVRLYRKAQNRSVQLLFKKDISVDPHANKLIKFDELKEQVPAMLRVWHQNYDKIAPISSYLVDSLRKKNEFSVPDFLIIAQALDGYHKRFVNKKNGKDIKKYEEQIKVLLNQFKDVQVIQECNIDPEVLKDTRHKYSHLYPDDEKSLAVEGDELYWLTEKCKILLTCCVLNMMGLTNAEIDLCCNTPIIRRMLGYLPFAFDE